MNGTKTKSANLLSGPAGTRKERHSQEPGASRRTGWLLVQCSVILPLLVMGASHGYAQTIPCGGEGQRVCEITDIDAYNEPFPFVAYDTGSYLPTFYPLCDLALAADTTTGLCSGIPPGGKRHLAASGIRLDGQGAAGNLTPGWTGFATQQQWRIQADQAMNWITIFGTHNSFSNYQDGAFNAGVTISDGFDSNLNVDQFYSIYDQLDLGARYIRLDPISYQVYALNPATDLRVCHKSSDTGYLDFLECNATSTGRLFQYALQEVAEWLHNNPDEVLVMRFNLTTAGDSAGIDAAIGAEMGNMVLTPSEWNPLVSGWPTLRQMRQMGKNMIIISSQDNSTYAFPWGTGTPPYPDGLGGTTPGDWVIYDGYTDYAPTTTTPFETAGMGFNQCYNLPASTSVVAEPNQNAGNSGEGITEHSIDIRTRPYYQWSYIGEDRSGSGALDSSPGKGLLGTADVATATACGFGIINVDFLASLPDAPYNPDNVVFGGETIGGISIPSVQITPAISIPSLTVPPVILTTPALVIDGITIIPASTTTLVPGFTIPGLNIPAVSTPSFTTGLYTLPSYTLDFFDNRYPNATLGGDPGSALPLPAPPATLSNGQPWDSSLQTWPAGTWPGNDSRRESAIWSWDIGDIGQYGFAYAKTSNGRWTSTNNGVAVGGYACAVGQGSITNPANYTWMIVGGSSWWNGQTACQNVGGTFWAPQSGLEQQNLFNAIQASSVVRDLGVWVNWVNSAQLVLEPQTDGLTGAPPANPTGSNVEPFQTFTLTLTEGQPPPPSLVFQYTGGIGGVLNVAYGSFKVGGNALGLMTADFSVNTLAKQISLGNFSGITDGSGNVNLTPGNYTQGIVLLDTLAGAYTESTASTINIVVLPPPIVTVAASSAYGAVIIAIDGVDALLPASFQACVTQPCQANQWTVGSVHTLDASKAFLANPNGIEGISFLSWQDDTTLPAARNITATSTPTTYTANFSQLYEVSVTQPANGTITLSPPGPYFGAGTNVLVTATPNTGYFFSGFTGTAVTGNLGFSEGKNPQTLTTSFAPITLSATFLPNYSVTFSTSATGEDAGALFTITTGGNTTTAGPGTEQFPANSSVTVTAPATFLDSKNSGIQYVFKVWADLVQSATRTITVEGSVSYQAIYQEQVLATINVDSVEGSVTGAGFYNVLTPITLKAIPNPGYTFQYFSGNGSHFNQNPYTFPLGTGPVTFDAVIYPNTTINATAPIPFTILVDGVSVTTPVVVPWEPAIPHTVSVPPQPAGTGYQYVLTQFFDGSTSTANPGTFQIADVPLNLQIDTARQANINASVSPSNGGTISGGGWYTQGTQATLTATAAGGYQFTGFSGDVSGSTSPLVFTVNTPANVVANFSPQSPQLNLSVASVADNNPQYVVLGLAFGNTGLGTAAQLQITNIAVTDLSGSGPVTAITAFPLVFGSVAGGVTSSTQTLALTWPLSATRIRLTVTYTYNSGAQGTQVLTLFR